MTEILGLMRFNLTQALELGRAIEDWRTARRECQSRPTRGSRGRYCEATDELARSLLGNFAAEPGAQTVFERFDAWLVKEEEHSH